MNNYLLIFLLLFITNSLAFGQNDTLTTDSGLKYLILKKGNGEKAKSGKEVSVHYHGSFADGKKFDSSYDRNEPIAFVLNAKQMIPGFDEGISLMNIGDKYKLIIPYQLAYGEAGRGDAIPPKATLIFDVELLSMMDAPISIIDTLYNAVKYSGIDSALNLYAKLKKHTNSNYDFREPQLNVLGYRIMTENKIKEAIIIFELNVKLFPESGNVYDSLAEGYMMNKEIDKSIEYYKIALEKNPANANAEEMIDLLKLEKEKMNN